MPNPLLDFARKVEMSIQLPTKGNWYPDGLINYQTANEVQIYPMLPKDEFIIINPDALLTGQANIDIIKSCVPNITNPELLYYPDMNVILLAIKAATYGDEISYDIQCPKCLQTKINLEKENKIDEIVKLEEENKICTHPQTFTFSISNILDRITYLEKSYEYKCENGLTLYLQPNRIKDKNLFNLLTFQERNIIEFLKSYQFDNDKLSEEEKNNIMKQLFESYQKICNYGNIIVSNGIQKVVLPDGSFVDDNNMILEFISNSSASIVNDIHKKIQELNDVGLPKKLTFECPCCHHQWEEIFFGFNQSDFFGISS